MLGGREEGVFKPTNLIWNRFAFNTSLFSISKLPEGFIRVASVRKSR